MLTSSARDTLRSVEAVIVDEIHALAPTKRGAHLALSLERLEELRERAAAAHRPVGHAAAARGGGPLPRRLVGARRAPPGHHRRRRHPQAARGRGGHPGRGHGRPRPGDRRSLRSGPAARLAPARKSIWPSIYPRILELVLAHRSTIIFCNARRLAERLAARLNELAETEGVDVGDGRRAGQGPPRLAGARAARRHRGPAEAGRAARARRHLQPRARHRHGRGRPRDPGRVAGRREPRPAAHRAGRPLRWASRAAGKHLPQAPGRPAGGRGRHASACSDGPHRGDPLPAQPARRAGPADRGLTSTDGAVARSTSWPPLVRRCAGFADLTDDVLDTVLDLLAGRYPSEEFGELRPAHRVGPRRRAGCGPATARSGWPSRAAAPSPTAGCSACSCPTAPGSASSTRRWSTRAGPARRSCSARPRGASRTSRFERVVVTPAPGQPGKMPFWHGDRPGRPLELGRALGAFVREIRALPPAAGRGAAARPTTALDAWAAANVVRLPRRAGRGGRRGARRPHRRGRALPRRDRRLAGLRAHALRHAGARAVGDGDRAAADRALRHAGRDDVERRRHRDPPARGGRRAARRRAPRSTPTRSTSWWSSTLPQHVAVLGPLPGVRGPGAAAAPPPARLAHAAVAAAPAGRRPAGGGGQVPDASRSCWRPAGSACRTCSTCPRCGRCWPTCAAAQDPPRQRRHAEGVAVRPEPAVQLDRRLHVRGRRAAGRAPGRGAGARPRPAARAARRRGAARAHRPGRAGRPRARAAVPHATAGGPARADELHDLLRRLGDLTPRRARPALGRAGAAAAGVARGAGRRAARHRACGSPARSASSRPRTRPATATPSAAPCPLGLPAAFTEPGRRARSSSSSPATPAPTGRSWPTRSPAGSRIAGRAGRRRAARAGGRGPGGAGRVPARRRRAGVVRRRGAAPAAAALARRAAPGGRAGRAGGPGPVPARLAGHRPSHRRGLEALVEALGRAAGRGRPGQSTLESDVLPRPGARATAPPTSTRCAPRGDLVWVGAGGVGAGDGRVRLFFRDQLPLLGAAGRRRRSGRTARCTTPSGRTSRERGACSGRPARAAAPGATDVELLAALWDLVWAGEVTNDSLAPLRSFLSGGRGAGRSGGGAGRAGRTARGRPRPGRLTTHRAAGRAPGAGRWSRRCSNPRPASDRARPRHGLQLLERHGVLTREAVLAEGVEGGSRASTACSRCWRSGARCAGATSWPGWGRRSSPCPAPSTACALAGRQRRRPWSGARATAGPGRHRPGAALRRGAGLARLAGPAGPGGRRAGGPGSGEAAGLARPSGPPPGHLPRRGRGRPAGPTPSPRWSRTVGCAALESARSTVSRSRAAPEHRSASLPTGRVSSTATAGLVPATDPAPNLGTVPEGDTIHRTAAALRAALLGKAMTAFEAPRLDGHRPAIGAVIERVESRGKHLEIGFDDGIVLHTHMRMTGSWHLYRPGEQWRKSTRSMRVVIEVEGLEAVCFSAPVVRDLPGQGLRRTTRAGAPLGPDLCEPGRRPRRVRGAHRPVLRRVDHGGRGAARPAGRLGRGQRLQERGPVGLRGAPVHPGRGARRRHPAGAAGDAGRVPPGQPRPADRTTLPGSPRAWRCTAATASRATGAARTSRSAATASSPGSPTGARCASSARTRSCRRGRVPTHRPRSTSSPPATAAVRRPSCSTTPATSADRSTRPTWCPRSSAIRPRRRCWPASSRGARSRSSSTRCSPGSPRQPRRPTTSGGDDATGAVS